MMYYTTVAGWMLDYFYKFAAGAFNGVADEAVDGVFSAMLANPGEMTVFMVIIVLAGFLVCSFGLQKGLERISKWMMLALLVPDRGAGSPQPDSGRRHAEGVKFYLLPDFQRAAEVGLGNVITAAMNQSFFTLSLGIAAMEIFGSYMSKDHTLTGEAVRICCPGHLRGLHVRPDHLPRLLLLRRGGGQRPVPDLHDPAPGVPQHGRRPGVGRAVLPVHDLRQLHHCPGGV